MANAAGPAWAPQVSGLVLGAVPSSQRCGASALTRQETMRTPGLCIPCGLNLSLPKKTFVEPGRGLCPALWLEGDPSCPDFARGWRGHNGLLP